MTAPTTTIPTTPVTTPSVQIIINGVLKNFDIVSASQGTVVAGYQFAYPVVGTTGRTAVQANAVDNVNVHGSAINFTLSHDSKPFTSHTSGLAYLHKAYFGGNADAVGIDVNGRIGKLTFSTGSWQPLRRGDGDDIERGDPAGDDLRSPAGTTGYPASGDLGGVVSATSIGSLVVGPANTLATTSQNPLFVQFDEPGFATYATTPGYSLTNAIVATSGSINQVDVTGPLLNTEIKTGFDYPSFVAGQEGTRAASQISKLRVRGRPDQQRHLGDRPRRQQPLQPQDKRQRQRLDHRERQRLRLRHRRHHRTGQHRVGRLRQVPQGATAGRTTES